MDGDFFVEVFYRAVMRCSKLFVPLIKQKPSLNWAVVLFDAPGEITRRIPAPRPAGRRFASFKFVPDKFVKLPPSGQEFDLTQAQNKKPAARAGFYFMARPERFELPTAWFVAL